LQLVAITNDHRLIEIPPYLFHLMLQSKSFACRLFVIFATCFAALKKVLFLTRYAMQKVPKLFEMHVVDEFCNINFLDILKPLTCSLKK